MKAFRTIAEYMKRTGQTRATVVYQVNSIGAVYCGGTVWECCACGGPLHADCGCCAPPLCNCLRGRVAATLKGGS